MKKFKDFVFFSHTSRLNHIRFRNQVSFVSLPLPTPLVCIPRLIFVSFLHKTTGVWSGDNLYSTYCKNSWVHASNHDLVLVILIDSLPRATTDLYRKSRKSSCSISLCWTGPDTGKHWECNGNQCTAGYQRDGWTCQWHFSRRGAEEFLHRGEYLTTGLPGYV